MEYDPRRLFDLSIDLLCVADLRGYFLYLNPAWERVLGYTLDELREKPFLDFVHPDDRGATLAEMEKLGRGVTVLSFDNRYRARDGTYRWFNWTSAPAPEEGLTYAIARDITERRRWEEAESERRELEAELTERRRNERHLRAQHVATREMTETGSVEDVAARVLRPLCENLEWHLGELWARESGAKAMRHRAAWHGDDPRLAAFTEASRSREFVEGAGLPGRAWGLGAPTWIGDAASEPGYNRAELAFAADLHTVVAVPVVVADKVAAAMCFFSRRVGEPDREVVEVLASVGL